MTRTGTGTLLVAAVLVTLLFIPLVSATGDELIAAPLNPAFVTYGTDLSSAPHATLFATTSGTSQVQDDTPRLGLIPSPVYRPDILDTPLFDPSTPERDQLASDQTSYDLRNDGKVSPVRNQGHFGTCWAFATYGSLESTLMPANPTPDFSEKNLVNLAGFPISSDPDNGGDIGMSAAYLARWNGPVNESTDPYPTGVWTTSGTYPPVYHIQNIVYFPGRTNLSDTANIKEALTRWGAVFSSFYWANTFYNSANTAYYQPPSTSDTQPGGGGHGVTIVGWDDTFAASNFNTPPPGNGAWLAKNSWGTGWGRSGYFYISYYDKYFGSAVSSGSIWTTAVVLGESTANYDTVYDYDRQGEVKDYSYATTRTGGFANVFTANTTETVTAIGFYTTDVNITCNISIYTNPTSGPIGGAPAALYNTTLPYMGYNTVILPPDQRVPVTAGTNFSVVLQVTNPTNARYIPVEENLEGYSGGITSQYGQGYLRGSTGWVDLKTIRDNSHVCVKAYTRSTTPPPVANFTANGTSGTAPLAVQFTDTSLGSPTGWNWSFGDNTWFNTSDALQKNPTHTYTTTGTYTVSQTTRNTVGTHTITKTGYISVTDNPAYLARLFLPNATLYENTPTPLPVRFSNITGGTGLSFNLTYDPSVIQVNTIRLNQSYAQGSNLVVNATSGFIRVILTCTEGISLGSPTTVLFLNATGTGMIGSSTPLTASDAAWSTSEFGLCQLDVINGTVLVYRARGDFNGNGYVDIGDVSRVAYMVIGLTPVDPAADFNGTGTVDVADAAKIACYLVGKVVVL